MICATCGAEVSDNPEHLARLGLDPRYIPGPGDPIRYLHVDDGSPAFPCTRLSEREAALAADPEMVEKIKEGIRQAHAGCLHNFHPAGDDEPFTNVVFDFDANRVLTDEEWERLSEAVVDVVFDFKADDGEKLFELGSSHRTVLTWNERLANWDAEEKGGIIAHNGETDE